MKASKLPKWRFRKALAEPVFQITLKVPRQLQPFSKAAVKFLFSGMNLEVFRICPPLCSAAVVAIQPCGPR